MTIDHWDCKKLNRELSMLGYCSYTEFLHSKLWWEFRKQVIKLKFGKFCELCKINKPSVLHHVRYSGLLKVSNTIYICKSCHKKIHFDINSGSVSSRTQKVRLKPLFKTKGLRFKSWGDTKKIAKQNKIPEYILLSVQASYHLKPEIYPEEFIKRWIRKQARTSNAKSKARQYWYSSYNNSQMLYTLVEYWCDKFRSMNQ